MGLAGPQATARARARMLWAESRGGLSQARGSGEVSIFLHRSHLLLLLQLRARCASLLAWHLPVFLLPAPYSSHPFPSLQRFVRTCVRAPTQPPSSPLLRISSSPSFPSLLACSLHLLGHSCTLFPPRTRRTLRLTAFACFPSVLTSVLMRPSSLPASLPLSHAPLVFPSHSPPIPFSALCSRAHVRPRYVAHSSSGVFQHQTATQSCVRKSGMVPARSGCPVGRLMSSQMSALCLQIVESFVFSLSSSCPCGFMWA